MPLVGGEIAAASILTFIASAIITAYVADWCGLAIVPPAVLVAALAAAVMVLVRCRRALGARWLTERSTSIFLGVLLVAFGWLMWLARPEFLPTGSGPDLVHHLALIEYIQEHGRLVHDFRLSEYLGEMVDYTPGLHLLVALVGAWLPIVDALHVVYPVIAFTVALKAGFVFLLARRLLRADAARDPFALVAVAALLAPRVYSIGSFTEQSYLAQVVAELFAVASWWAIVVWQQQPSPAVAALVALFAAAGFLVWPVWSGPLLILLAVVTLSRSTGTLAARLRQLGPAAAAVAVVAAMHGSRHVGGFRIAGTGGFVIKPTAAVVPWAFLAASAAAVLASAFNRRTRSIAILSAAVAVQAAALLVVARRSGAAAPYLAIKMFYLAIYPMAIAIAVAAAQLWGVLTASMAHRSTPIAARLSTPGAAWIAAAAIAAACARPAIAAPRPKPVVTEPVLQAAEWARRRVPRNCIDYLTSDGYTAYWLHLAVFGNPRASGRATDDDTFEPKKALVRWILPDGLPYAVTDDFGALPRDIRNSVDVLVRFGDAAVVHRRGDEIARCQ